MSSNRFNRRNISGGAGSFSLLPQITDRTAEQFLNEILKIHENQYTPINNIPTIFGRKINLLALYNAVAKRGGFKKMNTEWSWEGVLSDLKMPIKCANASVALRSIFQRYLEPFERLQRNKATINDIEEELQMESDSRYKSAAQRTTLTHCNFNPISMVYRSDMHQISSHRRLECGLSCDLSEVVEFHKLELSLKSGLPNEVEFSLNTILLMSFQSDGVQLCRNHRLLDLILSSIGITDLVTLRHLCEHDQVIRRFSQFWNDCITLEKGRKFLLPDAFEIDEFHVPEPERLNYILKVYDELTVYDKEGQRIVLVATILRNLALDTSNSRFITQNHQCMRFIILCCYASHFALRQIGLEILSMLSFPVVGILSETLRSFLIDLVNSEDRVERLRGLELLSNLSDQKVYIENTDFLTGLPKPFFASLISMLIIHDLHIVVLALEAVYGLSEVDSCLCTKLVECSSETLSTLYILLSLEAQVMGTQSLIRIRVMQGPAVITTVHSSHQPSLLKTTTSSPASPHAVPQSNHKQLATSLMPPPPVPTHKIPTTTVTVPHNSPAKPHTYLTIEAFASQNKPQVTQKIYPVITKNNLVYTTVQTTSLVPHPTLSSSPLSTTRSTSITSSIISSSPTVVPHSPGMNMSMISSPTTLPTSSSSLISQLVPHPNTPNSSTVVTISSMSLPTVLNHSSALHNPCISTSSVPTTPTSRDCVQTSLTKPVTNPSLVPRNNTVVVDTNHSLNPVPTPAFTNKQDFVKNWLLSNYLESPQCTVPLFVMYKQLQISVQNYFKDSEMVTAEEFHKLVRILFPQVQLVQLHTGNVVEIHYYNLKVSPKATTLENLLDSRINKPKQCLTDSPICATNEHHITSVHVTNATCPSISNDQKNQKRISSDMINGHSMETNDSEECPKKRPRTCGDDNTTVNYDSHNNTPHPSTKETCINNSSLNGMVVTQYHQNSTQKALFDERVHCPLSHATILTSQLLNGSVVEDLKHSDSETKAFSSSTVSPIHCESLANGTDGSSEETVDNELGRVVLSNMPMIGTHTLLPQVISHCPVTIKSEVCLNPTPPSLAADSQETNVNKRNVKKSNFNQLGRTRSRFRNTSNPAAKTKQRGSSSHRPHNLSYLYICEWDNCLQSFDKPQKVYGHVYTNHFMTLRTEVESMCFWAGCKDTLQRTPLPLLNHVNEQHCNNVALELARQVRLAKEKEKPSSNTSDSTVVKTEEHEVEEASSKFLNFGPLTTTNAPITGPPPSYHQSTPAIISTTMSQIVSTASVPLSSCRPHAPKLLHHQSNTSSSTTFVSSPSLSPVEQMIACSNILPQPPSPLPSATLSTPIIKQEKTLVSSIQVIPSPMSEPSVSRATLPSPQSLPQMNTTSVHVTSSSSSSISTATVIPPPVSSTPVSSTHNTSTVTTSPNAPLIKHALKEGPVTKHIRFLSALILRNLCQCSSEARRFVSARHQQIFEMSISGCESSKALSECLFYSNMEMAGTGPPKK